MSRRASKLLDLAVQYACRREGLPLRADFVRWARAALTDSGQVAIRLVDEDEGRRLNKAYRGKGHATNVLSFPYETEPLLMGDLVICPTVVAREAAEQGKPLAAHYAHLTVHGLLHLQAGITRTKARPRRWKTKKGRFSPRWVIPTLMPPRRHGQ